ncbi:hypothetical protein NDU88_006127 [Pleurodeles waltl]|uniref:Uncharacterized protein n=1 Tax=Pleurodeles waltl TaxID=8319 RepID=A0AAV7TWW3_PLEWA|nr:hypothetical protein NDU88_006127 [Pleurodeles waltl]
MQRRASQRGRRAAQEESQTPSQSSPARWATVSRCAQDPRCRRVARLRRASPPAAQSETRWFGSGRGWRLPQDRAALRGRGSRGRPPRPRRLQQPGGAPTPGNNGAQSQISDDNSNQHGADPRRHTPRSASILNRPRHRGPPRHHTGGTRATAVVRPPGGTGEAGSLSVLLGAPLVPLSPHRPCPAAGKHQAPSPGWEANFTPSGVPTRHSDLPLTPRGGPAHSLRARRGTPHVPGPRPQPASRPPGTIPAGPHESAGGHPRGNGPSPVAPPAIAAHLLPRSEPAAPQFSAGRPRPSARPQPLRSPDRPREPRRSPRGPSRAATVSPRLQQSYAPL